MLQSIEGLVIIGFGVGLLVGLLVTKPNTGCLILLVTPIAMVAYIHWWQGEHPENLRSTSALDFIFGPLWPSLGAIAGFYFGKWVRPDVAVQEEDGV